MGIDTLENVCTLLSVTIGALYALFKYIKTPKRGWLYLSAFFLTHMLSDYYWTIYTLVIGDNPDVSEFMAYFGWNVCYLIMLIFALDMRPEGSRNYFHPLILLPVPFGIWQFCLYIPYGGILNNIWEGVLVTGIACISLQVILYYFNNNSKEKSIPWLHTTILFFIIFEYGMWTSSCFDWSHAVIDPYYIFAFGECFVFPLLGRATIRAYNQIDESKSPENIQETHFTILLQITVAVILFFGGIGGYYAGLYMKNSIPVSLSTSEGYKNIAIALFIISIFLVIFILMLILMSSLRFKSISHNLPVEAALKHGRFNFVLTLIITFCLLMTTVIYTSRLFYKTAVSGVREDGQNKVYSTADDLENYLGVARSILWVTADTIDIMLRDGESQDIIRDYITKQTANQAQQFDENFTGIYAYINGEYMDGSGWIPPADYDVESRDWYKAALDAKGETIIVPPYVDAQTGSVVITICKLLNDGDSEKAFHNREVVALDMIVNHVSDIARTVNIGGKGYCFVVGQDGMIIAHKKGELTGLNVSEVYGKDFMSTITKEDTPSIEAILDGEVHTLFIDTIIDQWYVIIAVSDRELYAETNGQLLIITLITLVIFLLISFFYYLSYKNEQINARTIEEMRSTDLKRDYEAQILKEKEASATEANKAKSKFLAQMSHEIRTPINAILGMNEMILRTSKESQTLEFSGNIDSAGNILLALINTILDFSKIEDGKMEIIPANYDTSALIHDLINSIAQRAETKGLELIIDVDTNLPRTLFGDDVRLKQVIINLLTNAVKYTETGSVKLIINEAGRQDDNIQLHVSVQDTGIGIRAEDIDRLTLSFQRLDEQKNRNIEGTGLGMSIVSSLLSMMGSKICVESTYGEGSNFYFTIDQKIVDSTPIGDFTHNNEAQISDRSSDDLISAPGARVLVVDDNNLNLMVAKSLLTLCHISPDVASSGDEAVKMMTIHTYDIVFLDHMMPKMDGIETLQTLRAQNLIPDNTIMVALTANAVVGAREQYLEAGFNNYLSKPMEIKDLVTLLKEYLPADSYKNTTTNEPESPSEEKDSSTIIEQLKKAGIDTDTGIEYCGDLDNYFDVLRFFTKDYANKRNNLSDSLDKKDWANYEIRVHALKSNLRILGVQALAEKAYALEKAAKNKESDFIINNHSPLLEDCQHLVETISSIM